MTDEKKTDEREEMRKLQLDFLKSKSIYDLFVANAGRGKESFGQVGYLATQNNYLQAIQNPDIHLARVLSNPLVQKANSALKNGEDIYDSGISLNPPQLLKNSEAMIRGALTKLKVQDVLNLFKEKGLNCEEILAEKDEAVEVFSEEDKKAYVEDLWKKDDKKKYVAGLVNTYMSYVATQGIVKSIASFNAENTARGLEQILLKEPPKESKK